LEHLPFPGQLLQATLLVRDALMVNSRANLIKMTAEPFNHVSLELLYFVFQQQALTVNVHRVS
jgi:hypothetical protein